MEEIRISVIIPVYKVETYLKECVCSVLEQTYENIEVILVDDGSPDNSPQICDQLKLADSRVKTIHKVNGGLSDARNFGTEIATGDYIVYLDSDDFWSKKDALQEIIKEIKNNGFPDIIYFRRFTFEDGTGQELSIFPEFDKEKINKLSYSDAQKYLVIADQFIPSACNKFIRRELAASTKFTKGIVCEDIDWNFNIALKAKSLIVSNQCFYAYRRRIGSISTSLGERNVNDLLCIVEKWGKYILGNISINSSLKSALLGYCAYQLAIVLGITYSTKRTDRRNEFINRIKKLNWLWKYSISPKPRMVNTLRKLVGVRLCGQMLGFFFRVR